MTHDELMKALECCVNGDPCKECPVQGCATCVDSLLETAKNTIERKDEALTTIKQEFASQFEANSNLFAENTLLKEKVKTLETELKNITNVATKFEAECSQQDAEIERLKAELEHQKAIASAELDSLHKLGDDYEKVLEDEQKHIREAKRKAVMRFCQQILDANYCRIGVTDFIVCAINYICKECDEV